MEDTQGHLLLDCERWTLVRQRLTQWLEEETVQRARVGSPQPEWTWEFLVESTEGRLWLGRFFGRTATQMVYVRPVPSRDGCGHFGSGVSRGRFSMVRD